MITEFYTDFEICFPLSFGEWLEVYYAAYDVISLDDYREVITVGDDHIRLQHTINRVISNLRKKNA